MQLRVKKLFIIFNFYLRLQQQKKVTKSNLTSDATKTTDVNKTDSSLNAVGKLTSTTEKSTTSPSKKVEPDVRRPALLECHHCDELKGNDDAPNLRLHIFTKSIVWRG